MINKKTILIFFIVILLFFTSTAEVVSASEINTISNQLIALSFRIESYEEYRRLTVQSLELFLGAGNLILENPNFLSKEERLNNNTKESGIVNTSKLKPKIHGLKEASKGFIDGVIAKEHDVGLVSFSDLGRIDSFLTKDRRKLYAIIDLYKSSGKSCIHCGILRGVDVLSQASSDKGTKVMLLISDGHSSAGPDLPLEAAEFAKSSGIKIYTIALGNEANEVLLMKISKLTGGKFFKVECEESLVEIYRKISKEIAGPSVLVDDVSGSMGETFSLTCIEEAKICSERCIMNYLISILEPVYVLFITLIGFYLIFLSGSPSGRSKAKSALGWMLMSMCFITLSPYLLMILFSISHSMTKIVLSQSPENSKEIFTELTTYLLGIGNESATMVEIPSIPFILNPFFLIQALLFMLKIRFYLVLTFSILLPFAIILYPFNLTRGIGRILLEQTILWTFSQVGIAFVFVSVSVGVNLISFFPAFVVPFGLKLIIEFSGIILLILTPFLFVYYFRGFLP